MVDLVFARAEFKSGWIPASTGPPGIEVPGDALVSRPWLGDGDIVVTVVVAVSGRSPVVVAMAAPDEAGILAVSSSFFNLDFKSSSSSKIVEGAVVETVDSVPPARGVCGQPSSERAERPVRGDEWY